MDHTLYPNGYFKSLKKVRHCHHILKYKKVFLTPCIWFLECITKYWSKLINNNKHKITLIQLFLYGTQGSLTEIKLRSITIYLFWFVTISFFKSVFYVEVQIAIVMKVIHPSIHQNKICTPSWHPQVIDGNVKTDVHNASEPGVRVWGSNCHLLIMADPQNPVANVFIYLFITIH